MRIPGRRSSFHFFDSDSGHIYYLNKKIHDCVYHAIGKHFGLTYSSEECSATYEKGDDHCHPPHPRVIMEKILVLWKAQLNILSRCGYYNSSGGLWATLASWKWELHFALKPFCDRHKACLSTIVRAGAARSDKLHSYLNDSGPWYYNQMEDFFYTQSPSYWADPIASLVPRYLCKYFSLL